MDRNHQFMGLSESDVLASRREHGLNILTPPKKTPWWKLYIEKYQDPIIQILLVAAVISLVLAIIEHQYIETIGIFVAIFLATTVGFVFELDAAKKFNVLTQLNEEQKVKVIRNGEVMLISRKNVVVGDTVIIETGDEIPADGILNEVSTLQVDESMLTGEPLTTKNTEGDTASTECGAYPRNMVLRSTMVMNGRGVYIVTAIGDATEIGRVARQSSEKSDVKTPLNIQLDRLGAFINKIGFTLSITAGLAFLVHDMISNTPLWGPLWDTVAAPVDWMGIAEVVLRYFMMAVTLIVMAVPEGLPMAVTLALALNMRRMLKSNNLVRKLHACETMGAVTVICTDKTGTLTQNKMRVVETYSASATNLELAIAANTTAHLDEHGNGIGNPTEVALLLWLREQGIDYRQLREGSQIIDQIPFSTETKMMQTTVLTADGQRNIFLKGAPEIILSRCTMSAAERTAVENILAGYQQKAMRTLALASATTATADAAEAGSYTLQAIFGISDPIREEVPEAISRCHDAGINVKIVTGDVDATACEIGRQIGLFDETPSNSPGNALTYTSIKKPRYSISGSEFAALSDDEAMDVVRDLKIMSRARPQDKQRLVQLLQRQGAVVAVTGDGTNDAPALNHAHVGLSLGSGTNVAKEASDMTLLDDSFASIIHAVMWGRSLYKNIQRFLFFQLVVNVVALLLVIAGSIIGTEMPLTVTQILWVNLIMDTFAALALASLPPSREVLAEKPRQQSDFILSPSIIRQILLTGILMFLVMFVYLLYCERGIDLGSTDNNGVGVDVHELTLFFTTFVMLQWWNLFNAKTVGSHHSAFRRLWADRGLLLVLAAILIGQWVIVEFGGEMFRCDPLSPVEWIVIIAATSPVLLIKELFRLCHTPQR